MSAQLLDDLVVRVSGEANSFNSMTGEVEAGLLRLARTAGAAGAAIGAALSIPLGAAGAAMFRSFALMEGQITQAMVQMGAQGDFVRNQLRGAAFDISRNSVTSAYELAEAYVILGRHGVEAAQATEYLRVIEDFSVATGAKMESSTKHLIESLKALGLESKDQADNIANMTYLTDLFAKAGQTSGASADELARIMSGRLAASMRLFNVPMEEGLSILSLWTREGAQATEASSRLDRLLRHLSYAATHAAPMWKRIMGKDAFYDEKTGDPKPLADVMEHMNNVFKAMNPEAKRHAMDALGINRFVIDGIASIVDKAGELRTIQNELGNINGTVAQMKAQRLEDFTNQWKILKNQFTELGIEIGGFLAPAFMSLNKIIGAAVGFWHSLDPVLQKTIVYFALMVPGAMMVVGAITAITTLVVSLLPLLGALSLAMFLFFGIMAAEGYTPVETLKYLIEFAKEAYQNLLGFMNNFGENMAALMKWLAANWQQLWDGMKDNMGVALYNGMISIIGILAAFVPVMLEFGKTIGYMVGDGFRKATAGILRDAGELWAIMKTLATQPFSATPGGIALIRKRYREDYGANWAEAENLVLKDIQKTDYTGNLAKAFTDALTLTKGAMKPFGIPNLTPFPNMNLDLNKGPGSEDHDTLRRMLGGAVHDGIKEGMKTNPFDIGGANVSAEDFKQVNIHRFAIEGPGGLSKEGASMEDISKAQLKKLEEIADILREKGTRSPVPGVAIGEDDDSE